jgi:GNAT superfamily N-acetyltransferase
MISRERIMAMDHNFLSSMGQLMSNSVLGEFFDSYRFGIYTSGIPDDNWNIVFVKRTTSKPRKVVEQWEQFFAQRKMSFRIRFSPGVERDFLTLLDESGYEKVDPVPVMTLDKIPEKMDEKDDLMIRKVATPEELRDFQEAGEKGFSLPTGAGPYVMTEQTFRLPEIEMFLGYSEGKPVCTSMLFQTGDIAGIYWVSTLPEYRRRGFGEAITLRAVIAGKNRGCTLANLQASAMGKPVYERIGFDNPYDYLAYRSPK